MLLMNDILLKKQKGEVLSQEEIEFAINGMVAGEIPDYQISAWLMTIYFQGMTQEERIHLTKAMIHSGDILDLSEIAGIKVDKHSTGGVGDKTTLILAPLVAAAGVKVAKLSGRGLGHTGGTLDKLMAFENIQLELPRSQFIKNVNEIGVAVCGQTANLVPADKRIYALRDVTATVKSLPLIASSIMSKKLASGCDAIVLDVKMGSGGFLDTLEEAQEVARAMVDIGNGMNKRTVALITNMDQPLGLTVGNILEAEESIETLKGNGPEDLVQLCVALGAEMLVLSEQYNTIDDAKDKLRTILSDGSAVAKLEEMVQAQGGSIEGIHDYSKFKQPLYTREIFVEEEGFVVGLEALDIGRASMHLGAGRATKESSIDLSAGIRLAKKLGDKVKKGDLLATVYTDKEESIPDALAEVEKAFTIASGQPKLTPLILDKVK